MPQIKIFFAIKLRRCITFLIFKFIAYLNKK